MLHATFHPSPGLSAGADRLLFTPGDLGTSRYRRWVEHIRHTVVSRELVRHTRLARQVTGRTSIEARAYAEPRTVPVQPTSEPTRIRLPSPASGTLSRLP